MERPLKLLKPAPSPSSTGPLEAIITDPNTGRKTTLASRMTDPESRVHPPYPTNAIPELEFVTDPNTGRKTVELTLEAAVARMLAHSPEIRVVSFDPSIAKQDITRAAAAFDLTGFGNVNFEKEDSPPNSFFQPGQADVRTYETGIKQTAFTGGEWSVSYALTRSWDDLAGRTYPLRYEPIVAFQLRQPLLRDAWSEVTLAGVNIAKLNYKVALLGFREKSEDIATQAISAYWRLVQARRDAQTQRELLDRTLETLHKVEGRKGIDATNVQIKQTESFVKIREAVLLQTEKAVSDAQEVLVRLIADSQLNMLDEFQIIPVSEVSLETRELEQPLTVLETAMRKNPVIQQARIGIEIADINVRVAENQKMPRLDLIASTRTQGLHQDADTSHDSLKTDGYFSYEVGVSLEYPFGNRQREAELLRRRLERRRAVAVLQNIADQVAIAAKEGLRKIKTNQAEIQIQKKAVEAAQIHLQTLIDTEPVREQLTPEFLLVKLQAQETLANSQRSENRAIIDFNISLIQLARIIGTVLELHPIQSSMPVVSDLSKTSE
ncbi:MAG: TolC family protein [Sedimentisphaerales bacterium]|nr:TolC family protein [Sedimentisphaerales bacterium]